MAWMSIASRVVASRHSSASASATSTNLDPSAVLVCKSIDDIFFKAASKTGDRVVVEARVTRIFARTLEVQCEVHAHQVGGVKRLINQAVWVMELRSDDAKPLLQVDPSSSHEAHVAFEQALGRRALRIQRSALGSGHNLDPSWNFGTELIKEMEEIKKTAEATNDDDDAVMTRLKRDHGHHIELTARNMSSLLSSYWARGTGSWGLLEQASTPLTKLFMRKEGGLILVKAVALLAFESTTVSSSPKKKKSGLFGLFRKQQRKERGINDSETALGRLFSVLCDNSQRKSWDLLCEDCSTVLELDDTNDITRLSFKGMGEGQSMSDFSLLRSWRANDDR